MFSTELANHIVNFGLFCGFGWKIPMHTSVSYVAFLAYTTWLIPPTPNSDLIQKHGLSMVSCDKYESHAFIFPFLYTQRETFLFLILLENKSNLP